MIEQYEWEHLREVFVTRQECQDNILENKDNLSKHEKRLAVIETYQKIQLWILTAIGGAIITMLVKMFFGEG